jgi:hypothetical protein
LIIGSDKSCIFTDGLSRLETVVNFTTGKMKNWYKVSPLKHIFTLNPEHYICTALDIINVCLNTTTVDQVR